MNLGRVDLRFSGGFRPVVGRLNLKSGVLRIELQNRAGASAKIVLRQSMEDPVAWVELDEQAHGPVEIMDVAACEYVCKELLARGCEPPVRWRETNCGGFCQHLPADDAWPWRGTDAKAKSSLPQLSASAPSSARAS